MKKIYFCTNVEWDQLDACSDPRQDRRHSEKIDLSLRVKLELELKETLLSNADTTNISSIDTDLIVFDPEMEYFPKSFWQVSLVFFTWPYGIIRNIHNLLEDFCEKNNTWFSLWIDAHPLYVILFPRSDVIFHLSSLYSQSETDMRVAIALATYGLGEGDLGAIVEMDPRNWPNFFWQNCHSNGP